jgi:hypothetical protein
MAVHSRCAAIVLLAMTQLILAPRPADAGPTPKKPTPVVVRTAAGGSVQGILLDLGPESLSLLVADERGPVNIPVVDIERIQTARDSTRDGAIKGALTLGLMCMLACAGANSHAEYWGAVLANAVMGAGIGWGFDALVVSRATIYERNDRQLAIAARYRW